VTNDAFAGNFSFFVKRTNPAPGAFQHFGTDGVITPIDPSKVYEFSFYYKELSSTSNNVPATWISEFSPEIDHPMALSLSATDWTYFARTIGPSGSGSQLTWGNPLSTSVQTLFFAVNSGEFDAGSGTGQMLVDNISFGLEIPEPSAAVLLGLVALLGLRARRSIV
jgi:hypothetical protein